MTTFTYTSFEESLSFANSDEGTDWVQSQRVGATKNTGYQDDSRYIDLYASPEAAALSALVDWEDSGTSRFSVHTVRINGETMFGADIDHNDGMIHTDRGGFIAFLRGDDWLDADWVQDVTQ
jgi:hypothetical protein